MLRHLGDEELQRRSGFSEVRLDVKGGEKNRGESIFIDYSHTERCSGRFYMGDDA